MTCTTAGGAHAGTTIRRPLSQAMCISLRGSETLPPDIDQTVLDRLDTILESLASAPELDQAIRLPAVLDLAGGVSKSTWYALLNPNSRTFDPQAPKPFKLGPSPNSPSLWWRSAVLTYLKSRGSSRAMA